MAQQSSGKVEVPPILRGSTDNGHLGFIQAYLSLEDEGDGPAYLSDLLADMRCYGPARRLEYAISLSKQLRDTWNSLETEYTSKDWKDPSTLPKARSQYEKIGRLIEDFSEFVERTKGRHRTPTHRARDMSRPPPSRESQLKWFDVVVRDLEKLQVKIAGLRIFQIAQISKSRRLENPGSD